MQMQTSIKLGLVFVIATIPALAGQGNPPAASSAGNQPPPVQLTAQQDHQRMMDLLHITSLRPGAERQRPECAQRGELRRVEGQSVSQSARSAGTEERQEGDDGQDVVEPAPPGNRGGFRPRDLRPRPQGHSEGEVGSDQHQPRSSRRRASRHEETGRPRRQLVVPAVTVDIQLTLTTPANATGRCR